MAEMLLCSFHLKLKVFDVLIQYQVPLDYVQWAKLN